MKQLLVVHMAFSSEWIQLGYFITHHYQDYGDQKNANWLNKNAGTTETSHLLSNILSYLEKFDQWNKRCENQILEPIQKCLVDCAEIFCDRF